MKINNQEQPSVSNQYPYYHHGNYEQYYQPNTNFIETYTQWYNNLDFQQQNKAYTPEQYQQYCQQYYQNQYYPQQYYPQFGINTYQNYYINPTNFKEREQKKPKLSRNQKRKMKKKQLQEEYEEQKKKIGKWVDLERKDLVNQLKKIEEQETKIKEKKKEKLSHLIQIHKEVYKHIMKKNKSAPTTKTNHIIGRRKKKVSHIKKMKQLYQQFKSRGQGQYKGKIYICKDIQGNKQHLENMRTQKKQQTLKISKINEEEDDDYVTESEGEEIQKQKCKQQPKEIKFIDKIDYKFTGKLTNHNYNNITLREWVDHVPSSQLQDLLLRFINRLAYKQAINKVNKPQKYKKLIVGGVHQCRRTLVTLLEKKKCKLLVIALNIQKNELSKGIDDQIQQIIERAKKQRVPVVHISTRNKLGRAFTGKFGPRFTMLSIINYEGYQDMMQQILAIHSKQIAEYDKI